MDFLGDPAIEREAMPFGQQPAYLFRDSDGIDEEDVARFLVGIEEIKTTLANAYCDRLIGSLRRGCLDFLIPMNERYLRETLEYKFKGPCARS